MKMIHKIIGSLTFVVVAFCAVNVYSQKKSSKPKTPVFSSIYLNTRGKLCKKIEEEIFGCKPVGGYRIISAYHNITEQIRIETVGGELVARLSLLEPEELTRLVGKIEWRLADGKPFAVIARFAVLSEEEAEANKGLTGDYSEFPQVIVVKGLTGFEQIDFDVSVNDRTTPNADQEARCLADTHYRKELSEKF